jgi:hypothetical protein
VCFCCVFVVTFTINMPKLTSKQGKLKLIDDEAEQSGSDCSSDEDTLVADSEDEKFIDRDEVEYDEDEYMRLLGMGTVEPPKGKNVLGKANFLANLQDSDDEDVALSFDPRKRRRLQDDDDEDNVQLSQLTSLDSLVGTQENPVELEDEVVPLLPLPPANVEEETGDQAEVSYRGEPLLESETESREKTLASGAACRRGVFACTLHLPDWQKYVIKNPKVTSASPKLFIVDPVWALTPEANDLPYELRRCIQSNLQIAEVVGQYEIGSQTNSLHFQCMIVLHTEKTGGKEVKLSVSTLALGMKAAMSDNLKFTPKDGRTFDVEKHPFHLQFVHLKSTRTKLRNYCTDPLKRFFGKVHGWIWSGTASTLDNIHSERGSSAAATVLSMINQGCTHEEICDKQPGLGLMQCKNIQTLISARLAKEASKIISRCGNKYCKLKHTPLECIPEVAEKLGVDVDVFKQSVSDGCQMKSCYSFGPGRVGKTTFSNYLSEYWGDGSVYNKPSGSFFGSAGNCYTNEKCVTISDLAVDSFKHFGEFKRVVDCQPCPIDIKNGNGQMVASSFVFDSNLDPCEYFEGMCKKVSEAEYTAFVGRLQLVFQFAKNIQNVVVVKQVALPKWDSFYKVYLLRQRFFKGQADSEPKYVFTEVLGGTAAYNALNRKAYMAWFNAKIM